MCGKAAHLSLIQGGQSRLDQTGEAAVKSRERQFRPDAPIPVNAFGRGYGGATTITKKAFATYEISGICTSLFIFIRSKETQF